MESRLTARASPPVMLLALVALLASGCAGAPEPGWQAALADGIEDRTSDFAAGASILSGFDAAGADAELAAGDTLLYGIRLDTGAAPRIWFLRVRLDAIEVRSWLEMRSVAAFENRVTNARQRAEVAASARTPVDLADCFRDAPVARVHVEAFDASGGSLGAAESLESVHRLRIGLWSACVAGHAQRDLLRRLAEPGTPAAAIEVDDATHADIETVAQGIASCHSFFAILQKNPVTQRILYEVIALPSLWSIVVNFGVRAGFGIDFASAAPVAAARVPSAPGDVWSVPMTIDLNDQPALLARVLAAPPHGPAAAGAGVYGLVGRHPTDVRRRVHVQLLASRRGVAAEAPTPEAAAATSHPRMP